MLFPLHHPSTNPDFTTSQKEDTKQRGMPVLQGQGEESKVMGSLLFRRVSYTHVCDLSLCSAFVA